MCRNSADCRNSAPTGASAPQSSFLFYFGFYFLNILLLLLLLGPTPLKVPCWRLEEWIQKLYTLHIGEARGAPGDLFSFCYSFFCFCSSCRSYSASPPPPQPGEGLDPETIKAKAVFGVTQLVYTVVTVLPVSGGPPPTPFPQTLLFYSSYPLSCLWMVSVYSWGTWNGACYYIEVTTAWQGSAPTLHRCSQSATG